MNAKHWPEAIEYDIQFNCSVPLDNMALTTGLQGSWDIRDFTAVAALGDSLTAAFGAEATSVLNLFTDYRAVSWSGGGPNSFTLPYIMKTKYNPSIRGYSLGSGNAESTNAQFNDAITGGTVYDLAEEINILSTKIRKDANLDRNGYLMITLMIGANDMCAEHSPEVFFEHLKDALQQLYVIFRQDLNTMFKGVYVNLVIPPNVVDISSLNSYWCYALHSYECTKALSDPEKINQLYTEYVQKIYLCEIEMEKYSVDNFRVVVQPFLLKTHVPMLDGEPDLSYWSIDCFHFSKKAHGAAALALFNNLFEPVGNKTTRWFPHEPIECPKTTILP
jgi:phospholipase B1